MDDEGYLHNGGGLKFMDAFLPSHNNPKQELEIVEEVIPEQKLLPLGKTT